MTIFHMINYAANYVSQNRVLVGYVVSVISAVPLSLLGQLVIDATGTRTAVPVWYTLHGMAIAKWFGRGPGMLHIILMASSINYFYELAQEQHTPIFNQAALYLGMLAIVAWSGRPSRRVPKTIEDHPITQIKPSGDVRKDHDSGAQFAYLDMNKAVRDSMPERIVWTLQAMANDGKWNAVYAGYCRYLAKSAAVSILPQNQANQSNRSVGV